jgi:hypothetical protein
MQKHRATRKLSMGNGGEILSQPGQVFLMGFLGQAR